MIKLAKPYINELEINAVSKVLQSGNLVSGEVTRNFEEDMKNYLRTDNAIMVSNGTAALHLALLALEIGEGDEVLVPSFTFPATINVVELVGATPVLVDINIDSYCIDVESIEEKISDKTKVIIPVHEFGNVANMDEIIKIANKHNLFIVEDAACALGSKYKDKFAGTIGHVGCYSFHPRKAITSGEGGLVVTDIPAVANKVRILRNHGIEVVDGKIDFTMAGFNYRITDIQSAMLREQYKKFDDILKERHKCVQLYNEMLNGNPWIKLPSKDDSTSHTYQTYYVLIENGIDRDKVIESLRNSGIESNYGAYALHELTYYKNKYKYNCLYPNASIAHKQGISLPLYYGMTEQEIELVTTSLAKILEGLNE